MSSIESPRKKYEFKLLQKENYVEAVSTEKNYGCADRDRDGLLSSSFGNKSVVKLLKNKKSDYEQSFTVHGLTKTIIGSRYESIFWFLILSCGIFFACYMIHGRVSKYFKYDIYTEISSKITKGKTFPPITFCEANLLKKSYFSYCGESIFGREPSLQNTCNLKNREFKDRDIKSFRNQWSNDIFEFKNCNAWDGMLCGNPDFLISERKYNHSCVTWNYNDNFKDTVYGHVNISFHFNDQYIETAHPVIYAIPHDPGVKEIDLTKKVHLDPKRVNIIKLTRSVISRLPHPFPSNCTYTKDGDIFPGRYSRRGCMESHNYISMYKKCGDTIDYIKNYLPDNIINKYGVANRSFSRIKECMIKFSESESETTYDCPFPCQDEYISVFATSYEDQFVRQSPYPHTFYVNMQYEHVDTINRIEEKELYSWYQMVCEIGGFVSVVIGASLISCIEVIVYLIVYVTLMCVKM